MSDSKKEGLNRAKIKVGAKVVAQGSSWTWPGPHPNPDTEYNAEHCDSMPQTYKLTASGLGEPEGFEEGALYVSKSQLKFTVINGHRIIQEEDCACNKRECAVCVGGLSVCSECHTYEAGLEGPPCPASPHAVGMPAAEEDPKDYLVLSAKWSRQDAGNSCIWYRENSRGYTDNLNDAGHFTKEEALEVEIGTHGDCVAVRRADALDLVRQTVAFVERNTLLCPVDKMEELAADLEKEAANKAYEFGFGVSEWEAFLEHTARERLLALAKRGIGTWGKEPGRPALAKRHEQEHCMDCDSLAKHGANDGPCDRHKEVPDV